MPPAASAAAPSPADEPVEDAGPQLSPEEMLARRMGMPPKAEDPRLEGLLERSAKISDDPKMKELSSMLSSHTTEVEPAPVAVSKSRCSLRTSGRDVVERRLKDLERISERPQTGDAGAQGRFPHSASSPSMSPMASPTGFSDNSNLEKSLMQKERFSQASQRSQFRDHRDKTLKRLLVDMDLARPDQQKHYSHQSRCDHLDKMHGWYHNHKIKEKSDQKDKGERRINFADGKAYTFGEFLTFFKGKTYAEILEEWDLCEVSAMKDNKKATSSTSSSTSPPYLLFSNEGPVSPGSLRVQFKHPSPLLATLRRTGSSPTLECTS